MSKRAYKIHLEKKVVSNDLPSITSYWRDKIREQIFSKLENRPSFFGKPLRSTLKGYRSLRIGDYRVVFSIDSEKNKILIHLICHRSEVYKEAVKRLRK